MAFMEDVLGRAADGIHCVLSVASASTPQFATERTWVGGFSDSQEGYNFPHGVVDKQVLIAISA